MPKKTYSKIGGQWVNIKNVWLKINGEWKQNVIPKGKIDNAWKEFIEYYILKTVAHNFSSSTSRSRSVTLTLDGLISIDSITVNTGIVSYTVSGNKITINVSGGNGDSFYDSTKYSKSAVGSRTSTTNSFDSTYPYSSDGYTGTLYKSGSSYVSSGAYTPADTKYVEASSIFWSEVDIKPTKIYNSLGYYGVLNLIGSRWEDGKIVSTYGGNATRPSSDTRVYTQNYAGTAYMGGYTMYYSYKVDIIYKAQSAN